MDRKPWQHNSQNRGDKQTQQHADPSPDARQHHGFDQEDSLDISIANPDRAQQPDFTRSFPNRDPHHGQDPNRTDNQRHHRDRSGTECDDVHHFAKGFNHGGLCCQREVFVVSVSRNQQAPNGRGEFVGHMFMGVGDVDLHQLVLVEHLHRRREGDVG